MFYKLFLSTAFIGLALQASAQTPEDLLNELYAESTPKNEPVSATFKTTRIILSHSNETVPQYGLDFRVTHRFSDVAGANGGLKTFYGFDNSSDIRTAFEYGLTDRATIAIGRNKIGQTFDGHIKYRALRQTADNKMPFSVTLLASSALNTSKTNADFNAKSSRRYSYVYQAIIARKFSKDFSLALLPTMVHRNYVPANDANDLYALGVAGRIKVTSRFALVADYYYVHSDMRRKSSTYHDPLGLGFEIETGGHVFSLNFTNSAGIIENEYIPNTTSNWLKGEFRFGFNISRVFFVYRKDKGNRSSVR